MYLASALIHDESTRTTLSSPLSHRPRARGFVAPKKSTQQRFSIEDVEAANTPQRAWVAIRGNVYDLTTFADKHPGGRAFLLASVGRDATAMYESMHTSKNTRVLKKYQIGSLIETNVPQYNNESPFYSELQLRVDAYFKTIGRNPREAPGMLLRYAFLILAFGLMYPVMFSRPTSWTYAAVPWIAAAISGWTCAMMGFYLCHDSCHGSFTATPWIWTVMRRVYESITGLLTVIWFHQHVLGHHPYTNVIGADPDIESDDPGALRIHDQQPWYNHFRWQKYYWLPMYSQLALSRKLTEWKQMLVDGEYRSIKINPLQWSEYAWTAIVVTLYATQHFIIPYTVFQVSILRLLALHTVSDIIWSWYLTLIFQASHVNDDVAWPQPSADGSMSSDWAALQIEASLDFAHGSWWTTFLCGGLNYQAVHHLFPYMSQYYYPEVAPIVKQCCAEYGIKYNLKDSVWDMIKAHALRIELYGG